MPSILHAVQLIILSNSIKYKGALCQKQNLNVKEERIINIKGIIDVNPIADKINKSIPRLAKTVPIMYIIAKTQGINFKLKIVILYKILSIIFFSI